MSKNRALFLLSSSRVHGYGYLEHAKEDLTKFLQKYVHINVKRYLTYCDYFLLFRHCVKTVLFVPYALRDYDKYTATVQKAMGPWGYEIKGIHTEASPLEAVRKAEAIFIGGGNTFVLLKTLYDLQLMEGIRQAVLEHSVPYIGSSAGTNVATRSINTTNDMPMALPPSFDALKLVPFNINPHYLDSDTRSEHKGETRDERIKEFLDYYQRPVLGLREGTALLVQGQVALLVGDRKAKLFQP